MPEIKVTLFDQFQDLPVRCREKRNRDQVLVEMDSMHLALLSNALNECLEYAAENGAETVLGRGREEVDAISATVSNLFGLAQSKRRSDALDLAEDGDYAQLEDVEKVLTQVRLLDNSAASSNLQPSEVTDLDQYVDDKPIASVLLELSPISLRFLSRAVQLSIDFLDDWDFSIRTGFSLEEAAALRDGLEAIAVRILGPQNC